MIVDLLFDGIDLPNDYRPNDFYRAVMDSGINKDV